MLSVGYLGGGSRDQWENVSLTEAYLRGPNKLSMGDSARGLERKCRVACKIRFSGKCCCVLCNSVLMMCTVVLC